MAARIRLLQARHMTNDTTSPRDLWYGGCLLRVHATGADTGGAYGLVEELCPQGFAPPLHVQSREEEAFLILDGTVSFWVDGEHRLAASGEYVMLPRGLPHTFRVDSPTARMLNIVSPAGFEHFFSDFGEPAQALELPPAPDGPPDVARMQAVLADYGVQVLGPPPPAGS
jgi:quercetin dioxygenase-like cupin family protein